jgi:cellulose biosynthesis protein BcsQ
LLELQANAINTLANTQIPGTDTWIEIIAWIKDALDRVRDQYDVVFIDANPSFSIHTQIALSTANCLILPIMADDSSRRAIQDAFSLISRLKLPSDIYSKYAFSTKLEQAKRSLPQVHLVVKNRLTQCMGPASAYAAVLSKIEQDISRLIQTKPDIFTFTEVRQGIVDVRDFQATGVVAFARGRPFYRLDSGKLDIGGYRVQIQEDYRLNCIEAVDELLRKL